MRSFLPCIPFPTDPHTTLTGAKALAHGSITITDDPDNPGQFIMDRHLSGEEFDVESVAHSMILTLEDSVLTAIEASQAAPEQNQLILPSQGVLRGV